MPVSESEIRWGSYDVYEGPFFRGTVPFVMPANPCLEDQILATITAAEGGHWNAINMYDRCICTVGLIQWCEAGQFSVSEMLGSVYERDGSLLEPLLQFCDSFGVGFSRTVRNKWRFGFRDGRGEVDRIEEQRQLFLLKSSGKKGDWDQASRIHAKRWAAILASLFEHPEAIAAQRDFTVPKLYGFASGVGARYLSAPEARGTQIGRAFTCAFLSFAINSPRRAEESMRAAVNAWKDQAWTVSWLAHVLELLTFHTNVSIYPHRYEAIRPVLEKNFGIDLPDRASALKNLLSVKEIQHILVYVLGYDLGGSGPNGDGVDGIWGPKSQSALADFERRQGLLKDGVPDRTTNEALLRARDKVKA